jgi:competence protein ComEC
VISDSTQAVAIMTDAGMRLVGSNRTSFSVRAWSERYGADLTGQLPTGACDAGGCVADGANGLRLMVARSYAAAAEDCGWADIIVARSGAPSGCRERAFVVDASDLHHRGVIALYRDDGSGAVTSRTGFSDIERPWRAGRR